MVGEEETEAAGFVPGADQRGLSLIEVIIAIAIVAVAIALFIAALSTSVMGERNLNERVIGRNLATSQLELVLQAPYVVAASPYTAYPRLTNAGDYTATLKISYWYSDIATSYYGWSNNPAQDNMGLQYVTVTITDTREPQASPVYTLEGFKTSAR